MKKAFILVSLSSPLFSKEFFSKLSDTIDKNNESLEIIFLDQLEKINQSYIYKLSEEVVNQRVDKLITEMILKIPRTGYENMNIINLDKFCKDNTFNKYLKTLENEFYENHSFRRHCNNQTFINLQPILSSVKIFKKDITKNPMITNYLVFEIALKLFIYNNKIFDVEYSPRPEMEIINAIFRGKYINLKNLINERIEFITLN